MSSHTDDISRADVNVEFLMAFCVENKMLLVNNLNTLDNYYTGDKSVRQNGVWVSEIDTCVATCNIIRYIRDFRVLQRSDPPSDRAPPSLTFTCTGVSPKHLLERAASPGGHPASHNNASRGGLVNRPTRVAGIDGQMFADYAVDGCTYVDAHAAINDSADTLAVSCVDVLFRVRVDKIHSRRMKASVNVALQRQLSRP